MLACTQEYHILWPHFPSLGQSCHMGPLNLLYCMSHQNCCPCWCYPPAHLQMNRCIPVLCVPNSPVTPILPSLSSFVLCADKRGWCTTPVIGTLHYGSLPYGRHSVSSCRSTYSRIDRRRLTSDSPEALGLQCDLRSRVLPPLFGSATSCMISASVCQGLHFCFPALLLD